MDIEFGGYLAVNESEESEELLMPMLEIAFTQHSAGGDIEGGEEARDAVADVVVGTPLRQTGVHGQHGLSSIEGLDLAFLIDTENEGLVRGIQIEATYVPGFFHKERIGGEFEGFTAMRLESEGTPYPSHGFPTDFCGFAHGTIAPMGSVCGFTLDGSINDLGHLLVFDSPRPSRAHIVVEAFGTSLSESMQPLAHRSAGSIHFPCDPDVVEAIGSGENDCGPEGQIMTSRLGPRPLFEQFAVRGAKDDRIHSRSHRGVPPVCMRGYHTQ